MKYFAVIAIILSAHFAHGQQENEALEGQYPLNERYQLLKTKSQNYKQYKVIRENVLDGFWKIVRDSVAAKETAIRARDENINKLNLDLSSTQTTLKEKEESMAAFVYDSTHINVLKIDFSKGVFISIVAIIIGVLILGVMLMTGRLRMVHSSMKRSEERRV